MDTTTVDTSTQARAAAFSALEGHPMIMPAVVHAFELVYAELNALRARVAKLATPAAPARRCPTPSPERVTAGGVRGQNPSLLTLGNSRVLV